MNSKNLEATTPFNFGRAITLPFQHGPGSTKFAIKSAVFYAVAITVLYAVFGRMMIGTLTGILEMSLALEGALTPDEEAKMAMEILSMAGKMMLPIFLMILGIWVIWAMIEAELHRRNLRHEFNDSLFPWRFGKDELRVMLCQLVVWVIAMVMFFIVYFIVILGAVAAFVGGGNNAALGVIGGLVAFAVVIGGILLWALIAIRFAPAAALSIAEDRLAIGEAWGVTKGRFWWSFLAYLVVWIVGYIIIYIIQTIIILAVLGSAIAKLSMSGLGSGSEEEAIKAMIDLFTDPGMLVGLAIATLLSSLFSGIWSLCVTGVGSHLVSLRYGDRGLSEVDVFT